MSRGVLVCHCLLDPLTRAQGTKKVNRDIITVLVDAELSMIQLPCPEMMYGFLRPPRSKEEYDTPEYRRHCRELAETAAKTVKDYENAHFHISGIISVGGSPSCGFQRTHVKGEHAKEPGIFMEEVQRVFREQKIDVVIIDHDLLEDESERERFLSL